jgi:hypothetical protein
MAPVWWTQFCERHLVADDPTQYEAYSVDDLNDVARRIGYPQKVLINEILYRLGRELSHDDREILTKALYVLMAPR